MSVINKYYSRSIEKVINKSFSNNKVVTIIGARQVGKSTLVEKLYPNIDSIALKTDFVVSTAKSNPDSFLKKLSLPAYIDEAQRAPELFGSIQDIVDNNAFYSQFILSGSNSLSLDNNIKESLSGRSSIIKIVGLSMREIFEIDFDKHFVLDDDYLKERRKCLKNYGDIYFYIHRGSYPELYDNKNKDWEEFYSSYVQTYIEKDVLTNISIKDMTAFTRFLIAVASRTGEVLNYESIASDVGTSPVTIKTWISLLVRTNIIFLLEPYYSSHLNRIIKSSKLYFYDTGLAAYLAGWLSKDQLERGAKSSEFFETFVVNEIIKSFINRGEDFTKRVFYYRGKDKKKKNVDGFEYNIESEIDLIIEENGILYPIEIKKKDKPTATDASSFDVLDKVLNKKRGLGAIVCTCSHAVYLKDDLVALPIEYL